MQEHAFCIRSGRLLRQNKMPKYTKADIVSGVEMYLCLYESVPLA